MSYKRISPIPVIEGGTGRITLTDHSVLVGAGTAGITSITVGTNGQVLTGNTGADPSFQAPAASSITITGNTGGALTGNSFIFTGGTTGLSFGGAGSTETLTFAGITANGGTVSLATDATTSAINIGNGAGVKTSVFGSTFATSTTTIQGPNAGVILTGVQGVAVSNKNYVTIDTATGVIGSDAATVGAITQIDGDTGTATGSTITFNATVNAGASYSFDATGSTVILNASDINGNTFIGNACGLVGTSATNSLGMGLLTLGSLNDISADGNCVIGQQAAVGIVSGAYNSLIGFNSMKQASLAESGNSCLGAFSLGNGTGCNGNISIGFNSMSGATDVTGNCVLGTGAAIALNNSGGGRAGTNNISIGDGSFFSATTANFNVVAGVSAANNLLTGISNVAIGSGDGGSTYVVASNWQGSETGNICIQNIGVTSENHAIRIGTQGSGDAQQNTCYIAGITAVNVGSVANVVSIATGTGQLGTTAITAGTGISVTPGANTITIANTATSFTWAVTTADAGIVVNNGYIANKGGLLTMTLPASGAIGNSIRITGINTAVGWRIAQNASQQIFFGAQSTTVGVTGYIEATAIRDSVELVCVVSGTSTVWNVISSVGNITVV